MNKNSQHVVPNGKGQWSVKKSGSIKATKTFTTKLEAEIYGRSIAKNQKSELYIHKTDGTIQTRSNYKLAAVKSSKRSSKNGK